MRVRGGSGLGDSIYLRPIVDHLQRNGSQVTVMSHHPDVFIGTLATVIPVNKAKPVDMIAHYTTERFNQGSTQWQDILRTAKLPPDLPLRFNWTVRNPELRDQIRKRADSAPILLVHGGRAPFGRTDGYGKAIMPRQDAFQTVLDVFAGRFTVRIGKGEQYPLWVSLDLSNKTSVSDMLDLATICDGIVTQCGFPVPLGECFDKPVLAVWSAKGLGARDPVVASVTPNKILCGPKSSYVVDDWDQERMRTVARASLLQQESIAA